MSDHPIGEDTDTLKHVDHNGRELAVTIEEPFADGRRLPAILAVQDLAGGAAERHRLDSPEVARYRRLVPAVEDLVSGFKPTASDSDPVHSTNAPELDYDKLAAAMSRHQQPAHAPEHAPEPAPDAFAEHDHAAPVATEL